MARKIISVIAGVIVGFLFVFIGDSVCMRLYAPPIGLNPMDQINYNNSIAGIPTYVMVIMLLFWMLSAFFGGLVTSIINKAGWKKSSLATGGILLAASILNMINVSHPTWMVISAVILYIPMAYLGGMVVSNKKP